MKHVAPTLENRRYYEGLIRRRGYDVNEFSNREDVLKEVEERVSEGRSAKEIRQSVLLLWGVNGIGKSWLLQHLETQYRLKPAVGRTKGTVSVRFDFHDYSPSSPYGEDLVRNLAEQLERRLPDKGFAEDELPKLNSLDKAGTSENKLATHFAGLVTQLCMTHVPVFLFDTVDELETKHYDFFAWFEEWLLAPLVRWDHVLIVLGSRHELRRLKQFEVRRRLKKLSLQPFDLNATIQQVHNEQIGAVLYPLTFGHPLATWYMHRELDSLRVQSQAFDAVFLNTRKSEISGLLTDVEDTLLSEVDLDLRKRLVSAATLRAFHIRSLQMLFTEIEGDKQLQEKSDSFFQQFIARLVETNLVRWSMSKHGYEVESAIRHILNRSLALRDEDEYIRRQNIAFDLYAQWATETPWSGDSYLIESMYHLNAILLVQPTCATEMHDRFERLLKSVLESTVVDLQRADTIKHTVSGDDELKDITPALLDLLYERLNVAVKKPPKA